MPMNYEDEIQTLKARLVEMKWAVASLAALMAQEIAENNPASHQRLTSNLRSLLGRASSRGTAEAHDIFLMLGQAFVDPSFPMSSDVPEDRS